MRAPFSMLPCLFLLIGCTVLPDVRPTVEHPAIHGGPPEIIGAGGRVSRGESRNILADIKERVESTDILERHAAVMDLIGAPPLLKDNKATLLIDGPRTYDAMFRAISDAQDHIHFETFIIRGDEMGEKLAELLLRKRSEGVAVHFIYDSVGGFRTPESYFQRLRDGGIRVVEFNPVDPAKAGRKWKLVNRDHRKILIVDGKLAVIGGINISEEYSSGPSGQRKVPREVFWRDTDVQIEGPAVGELQKLFLDTWKRQRGPVLPPRDYFPSHVETPGWNDLIQVVGSTPGDENRLTHIMYVSAFRYARNSIHLTNAYFLPDRQTIAALTGAAKRGVDVKIIVPGSTDIPISLYASRYNYKRLLKAGIKLYEHGSDVLHAKTAVIDGVWSTVGSANMDMWSFTRNEEVNAIILSRDFAKQMEDMFAMDLRESREIRLEEWKERPLLPRVLEWYGRLISHWL